MRLEDICNKRPFSCDQQWELLLAADSEEQIGQLTCSAPCGVWSHCCRLFSLSAHRPSYAGKAEGDDDLLLLHKTEESFSKKAKATKIDNPINPAKVLVSCQTLLGGLRIQRCSIWEDPTSKNTICVFLVPSSGLYDLPSSM